MTLRTVRPRYRRVDVPAGRKRGVPLTAPRGELKKGLSSPRTSRNALIRRSPAALTVALLALGLPATGAAQAPGYKGPDARQLRAQYLAEVIGQMNGIIEDWTGAWSADDLDALADLYVEDAVLIPPGGEPLRGWPAIRGWFAARLPEDEGVAAFLQDFDAAGGMAMGESNYRIERLASSGGGDLTGRLVTVLVQRGNRWRIRTQVFVPYGSDGSARN